METKASNYLKQLKTITREELLAIDGLGPIIADNFLQFINSDKLKLLEQGFKDLENNNKCLTINILEESQEDNKKINICITGTFEITREEIKKILEDNNYKVVDQINKKVDILISGQKAGSKVTKSEKLGIKILDNYQELIKI